MEQALYQAAVMTFEELGFMFPERHLDKTAIEESESVRAAIDFSGAFAGKFVLQIEREILPLIAANMLGEELPIEEAMQNDVLGEIANVICGNTLPSIGGRESVFNLSAPHLFADGTKIAVEPSAIARLELEDGRADVLLYLD